MDMDASKPMIVTPCFGPFRSFAPDIRIAAKEGRPYTSESHNSAVLSGMNDLRQYGALCDVKLVVEDVTYEVHRVILASCSPYFRSMFTSEMKESRQDVIKLQGFTAIGLKHVLDFIYTSTVYLDVQNMHDILTAANHLQITAVVKFCCNFMESEVNLQNCVDICNISKFFNLVEVEDCVYSFILKHFTQFVNTDEFLKLSVDDMCRLLTSNNIKGHTELELFNAADKWITHDKTRLTDVYKVMSNIRFPLISPEDIDEKVQTITYMQNECCMKLLFEATKYHMLPHKQPLLNSSRMLVRSNTSCLVALGGKESTNSVSKEVQIFNKDVGKWLHLGDMDIPAYCHCVAVLSDFLYVVGGQEQFDNNGNTAMGNVYRYDPRFDTWLKMANMNETRTDFAAIVIDGCLYAVAGRNNTGPLSSCEKYRVDRNKWEQVSELPQPVCAHAGAACQDKIYVAGGFASDGFQRGVYSFDPRHGKWEVKPRLKTERGLHCMVAYKQCLYCIGGNNKTNGARRDVLCTEMYDIRTEQWCDVAPLFAGQSEAGAAVVEGKIYVVGGHTWRERKDVRTVACYDPERDAWEKAVDFPEALTSVACCALKIPENLLTNLSQKQKYSNNGNVNMIIGDEDLGIDMA